MMVARRLILTTLAVPFGTSPPTNSVVPFWRFVIFIETPYGVPSFERSQSWLCDFAQSMTDWFALRSAQSSAKPRRSIVAQSDEGEAGVKSRLDTFIASLDI